MHIFAKDIWDVASESVASQAMYMYNIRFSPPHLENSNNVKPVDTQV